SLVFLVDPKTASILRELPRFGPGLKLADVVRTACRRALAGEISTTLVGSAPRTERVRIHAPATFHALCRERAERDGQTLCRWVAGALSEHLVDAYRQMKHAA